MRSYNKKSANSYLKNAPFIAQEIKFADKLLIIPSAFQCYQKTDDYTYYLLNTDDLRSADVIFIIRARKPFKAYNDETEMMDYFLLYIN